jgi:hypothetical protein
MKANTVRIVLGILTVLMLIAAFFCNEGCGTVKDLYDPETICTCTHANRYHNAEGICDSCDCTSFNPAEEYGGSIF